MSLQSTTNKIVLKTLQDSSISECFECESKQIKYDNHLDEHFCLNCGLILRQNLADDYIPLEYAIFPKTSQENKARKKLEQIKNIKIN